VKGCLAKNGTRFYSLYLYILLTEVHMIFM